LLHPAINEQHMQLALHPCAQAFKGAEKSSSALVSSRSH
jgi:hypothetical protein